MIVPLVFSIAALLATQGQSSLRGDLEQARALVEAKDGDAAHARVLKIFEDHQDSVELIRHLPAVQDCLVDSLFLKEETARLEREAAMERPVIPFSASVLSYKEKSGIFNLRWEGETQLNDFSHEEEEWPIPMDLEGRCRIALDLLQYPEQGQIKIIIEAENGLRFEVECGNDASGINHQVALVSQIDGDKREILQRVDKKLPQPGEPVLLALKSLGSSMQLYAGRSKILTFKAKRAGALQVTFSGVQEGSLGAIEYDGPLDPDQLVARMSTLRERQRQAFRAAVDFRAETPDWVHPFLSRQRTTLEDAKPPGRFPTEAAETAWQETAEFLRKERRRNRALITISILQNDKPEGLTPAHLAYSSMIAAYEGGYWEYGRNFAEDVLQAFPEHAITQEVLMECLARMDEGDLVWEIATNLYKADPMKVHHVLNAVKLLMCLDMVDDVRFFLMEDESIPQELKTRCEELLAHREGPKKQGIRIMKSRLIEIHTDLEEKPADEVDLWMGREVSRAIGFLPEDTLSSKEKLRLFLFADRWDYEEFCAEILGAAIPSASGFYAPAFDAVVAWYNPQQQDREDSLRREMMIHVGKRIHPEYPLWASIGLSELVADGSIQPGKDIEELSSRAKSLLEQLRADGAIPFSVMLCLNGAGYRALEQEHSLDAQAWAMCVWLMVMNDISEVDFLEILVDNLKSSATWADTTESLMVVLDSTRFLDDSYSAVIRGLNRLSRK